MFAATPALAQVCLGVPLQLGSTAGIVTVGFPDNANTFGIGAVHRFSEAITAGAQYQLTTYDFDGVDATHGISARGAYELPMTLGDEGLAVSICPNAGLQFSTGNDVTVIGIPLGVGIGAAFPLGQDGASVTPYLNPMLTWARASFDGASDSDTDLGFELGANIHFGQFLVGPHVSKIGDGDATFGFAFGMRF